jgi:chromosome partitioning protein
MGNNEYYSQSEEITMVLTLATTKGGTGKSTLALNLADDLQRRGATVEAVDLDPQKSLAEALKIRESHCHAKITCWEPSVDDALELISERSAAGVEVVVDTAGFDNKLLWAVLSISDIVLVPVLPSRYDINAALGFAGRLETFRQRYTKPRFRIVLNQWQDRTRASQLLLEDLRALHRIVPAIAPCLAPHTLYREAAQYGLGATTFKPREAAATDIRALTDNVIKLLSDNI